MRRSIGLVIGLVFIFGLTFSMSVQAEEKVVMKWGHTNCEGAASYDAPYYFAKKISEITKGRITCNVYPCSQLGGERDLVESAKLGTIQLISPAIATLTLSDQRIAVYEVPFLFKDRSHILRVARGPFGKRIEKGYEAKVGLKILDYFQEPNRGLYNDEKPVYTPEDMKGKKIRVMEAQIYKDMFEAVGALPTPLPFPEMYTGLATKLVDFGDTPIVIYYSAKHYEVCKYYSITDHVMCFKPLLITAKFFYGLSPEDQQIVAKTMAEAAQFQRDLDLERTQETILWLANHGYRINYANQAAFAEKMEVVYEKMEKRLGKEFWEDFIKAVKAAEKKAL